MLEAADFGAAARGDMASKWKQYAKEGILPLEQTRSLEFDLAVLIAMQSQALEISPYLRMSRASQVKYNERRKQISDLREMLSKMKGRLQLRICPKRAA